MKYIFFLLLLLPIIAAIDVGECKSLNQSGGDYILNQSISSETTCLEINNASIILDCKGFQITAVTSGILVNDFDNVTIKNCEILGATSYSIGWMEAGNNLSIFTLDNITTPNTPMYGLFLDKSSLGGYLNFPKVTNSNMASIGISDSGDGGLPYGEVDNSILTATSGSNAAFDASSTLSLQIWTFTNDLMQPGAGTDSIVYENTAGGAGKYLKFIDCNIIGGIGQQVSSGSRSSRIYLINSSYSQWDYTAGTQGSQAYLFVQSDLVLNVSNSTSGIQNILTTAYTDADAFLTNGTTNSNGILILPVLNWYEYSGNFYSSSATDITPLSGLYEDLVVPGQKVEVLINTTYTNTSTINFTKAGVPSIFLNFLLATATTPAPTPTPTAAPAATSAIIYGGSSSRDLIVGGSISSPSPSISPLSTLATGSSGNLNLLNILFALILIAFLYFVFSKRK